MKALVRSIVMLLVAIPLTVNAAPAKKPGSQAGPKGMHAEAGKKGKKKKDKQAKPFVGKKQAKKQKKGRKSTKVVVVKQRSRHERRVEALLSGRHVVYVNTWAVAPGVVSEMRLRQLLRRLDRAHGPMMKLEILSHASAHRFFTVRQASKVLRQFRNQQVRLEALKIMRTRIVDQRNFHKLLGSFKGHHNKQRAAGMLAAL